MIDVSKHKNLIFGGTYTNGMFSRKIINSPMLSGNVGMRVRFTTNSSTIGLSYDIDDTAVMPIMGCALTKHFLCVIFNEKHSPILRQIIYKQNQSNDDFQTIYRTSTKKLIHCELYFPSIQTVNKLFVQLDDNAFFEPFEYAHKEPILFFGGKSTFGYGSTFAQAMYSQIVARNLNRDFFNLSIDSFDSYYANEIVKASAKLNPAYLVSEITSASLSVAYCKNNMDYYLKTLASLEVPVILLSQPFWGDISNGYEEKRKLLIDGLQKLEEQDYKVFHIDGAKIFKKYSYDCYSYSLCYVNDFANYIVASEISNLLYSLS